MQKPGTFFTPSGREGTCRARNTSTGSEEEKQEKKLSSPLLLSYKHSSLIQMACDGIEMYIQHTETQILVHLHRNHCQDHLKRSLILLLFC